MMTSSSNDPYTGHLVSVFRSIFLANLSQHVSRPTFLFVEGSGEAVLRRCCLAHLPSPALSKKFCKVLRREGVELRDQGCLGVVPGLTKQSTS